MFLSHWIPVDCDDRVVPCDFLVVDGRICGTSCTMHELRAEFPKLLLRQWLRAETREALFEETVLQMRRSHAPWARPRQFATVFGLWNIGGSNWGIETCAKGANLQRIHTPSRELSKNLLPETDRKLFPREAFCHKSASKCPNSMDEYTESKRDTQ